MEQGNVRWIVAGLLALLGFILYNSGNGEALWPLLIAGLIWLIYEAWDWMRKEKERRDRDTSKKHKHIYIKRHT